MDFNRCYGCMRELDAPGAVCPHCGYDNTNDTVRQPNHVLPCGTVLGGRYVIGRVLGQGGFGITYLGWNLTLEIAVCIKEYFPDGAAMRSSEKSQLVFWGAGENSQSLKQSRESFVKEARKAVKLNDLPSVVNVWDVFYENDTAYIVMNYIEGETLKNRLVRTQKTLNEKECVELLTPVIMDLARAHELGIIHRDIKPDNLMLKTDGKPVLLDMGAAKDLGKAAQNGAPSSTLVVSQGFSPLEQYRTKGNIGPWTDVYGMCATIYYCVTGRLLPTPMDRLSGETVSFAGLSAPFAAALEKGLAIQPENRTQTMGELIAALTATVGDPDAKLKPVKKDSDKTAKNASEVPKKKNRLVPALAIAAALLIAAGVYFLKGIQPDIVLTPQPSTDVTAEVTETPTSAPTPTPTPTPELTPEPTPEPTPTDDNSTGDSVSQGREAAEALTGLGMKYFTGRDVDRDYSRAEELFQQAAGDGDTTAMCALGDLYYYGYTAPADDAKALSWYRKAADGQNFAGMVETGLMYSKGLGTEEDPNEASAWAERAMKRMKEGIDTDDVLTGFALGRACYEGFGLEKDYSRALGYFQKAADAGYTPAIRYLGTMYRDGYGVETDYDKALVYYRKAADAGDPLAMNNMGVFYREGYGVEQDFDKALEWHRKAMEKGEEESAAFNIGYLYYKGVGREPDYARALEWYRKAAEMGNSNAMYSLGMMYQWGFGVAQDYDKALEWYGKAAELGNGNAMQALGAMYQLGKGVEKDYGKAIEWYQKGVENENAACCYSMGQLYETGTGVEKDYGKAMEYYQKSADGGNVTAMFALGMMYENGNGVSVDYDKAMEWYRKAADAGFEAAKEKLTA